MVRRRNSPSPYEVMTSPQYVADPSTLGSADLPVSPGSIDMGSESVAAPPPDQIASGVDGGIGSWWKQAQQPIVLRLPKGHAVLLGLVVLGLILLAYWVGSMRGYRSGLRQPSLQSVVTTQEYAVTSDSQSNHPSPVIETRQVSPDRVASPSRSIASRAGSEPRQVGLNYFVLAHYPQQDAKNLVRFLSEEGMAGAAFRKKGKKQYQVIALRGFHKDELDSDGYNRYKQQLLRLGRVWHSRGLGPNFSGIFPALYTGQKVEEIIVSEIQP